MERRLRLLFNRNIDRSSFDPDVEVLDSMAAEEYRGRITLSGPFFSWPDRGRLHGVSHQVSTTIYKA